MAPAIVSWVACTGLPGRAGPPDGVAAIDGAGPTRGRLGRTSEGRAVTALVGPGRRTDHRALVLGTVHGTEQGGIEVAEQMRAALLDSSRPRPTAVLVSPDLAGVRRREDPAPPTAARELDAFADAPLRHVLALEPR